MSNFLPLNCIPALMEIKNMLLRFHKEVCGFHQFNSKRWVGTPKRKHLSQVWKNKFTILAYNYWGFSWILEIPSSDGDLLNMGPHPTKPKKKHHIAYIIGIKKKQTVEFITSSFFLSRLKSRSVEKLLFTLQREKSSLSSWNKHIHMSYSISSLIL